MNVSRVLKYITNFLWGVVIVVLLLHFGLQLIGPTLNGDALNLKSFTQLVYSPFEGTVENMDNSGFVIDGSAMIGAFFIFFIAVLSSKFFDVLSYSSFKSQIVEIIHILSNTIILCVVFFFFISLMNQTTTSSFNRGLFAVSRVLSAPLGLIVQPISVSGLHLELAAVLTAFVIKIFDLVITYSIEQISWNRSSPVKDNVKPEDIITQVEQQAETEREVDNGPIPLVKPNLDPVAAPQVIPSLPPINSQPVLPPTPAPLARAPVVSPIPQMSSTVTPAPPTSPPAQPMTASSIPISIPQPAPSTGIPVQTAPVSQGVQTPTAPPIRPQPGPMIQPQTPGFSKPTPQSTIPVQPVQTIQPPLLTQTMPTQISNGELPRSPLEPPSQSFTPTPVPSDQVLPPSGNNDRQALPKNPFR